MAISSSYSSDLIEANSTFAVLPKFDFKKMLNAKFMFYFFLMLLTMCSNSYVIYVVLRHKSNTLRWRLNLFLVHLAVTGLLVSVTTMPATLIAVPTDDAWIFGVHLCKLRALVQVVSPVCTSFLLVGMACDRYYAIVQNTRHKHQNLIMVSVSWVLAIVLSLPQLYGFGLIEQDGRYFCDAKEEWVQSLTFKFYLGIVFFLVVLIPTFTNVFCYGRALYYLYAANNCNAPVRNSLTCAEELREKRKSTTKFAISIVCSYLLCWLPYFVLAFLAVFWGVQVPEWASILAEGVAMSNFLVNPLLYCGYSMKRKQSEHKGAVLNTAHIGVQNQATTRAPVTTKPPVTTLKVIYKKNGRYQTKTVQRPATCPYNSGRSQHQVMKIR